MANLVHSKTAAAAFGLLTHFIANRGEWDHHIYLLIPGGAFLFGALVAFEYLDDPRVGSLPHAFHIVGVMAAVYLATLATSIVVYRAYFHRLRKVIMCRTSSLHTLTSSVFRSLYGPLYEIPHNQPNHAEVSTVQ